MSLAECSSSSSMALMGRVSSPGRRSKKVTFAFLLVTFCFFCLAGFAQINVSPASAHKIYFPGPSFGSEGSGNGQFKEPVGVAVNDSTELGDEQAGDVYVADKGNKRVEVFSAAGVYPGPVQRLRRIRSHRWRQAGKEDRSRRPGRRVHGPRTGRGRQLAPKSGTPPRATCTSPTRVAKRSTSSPPRANTSNSSQKPRTCEKEELPEELPPCPPGTGKASCYPVRRTAQRSRRRLR